ncbi:MAG: hypothetical protein AAGF98_09565 [Cyanobacteria bacterium P01_H01_bin.153]
MVAVLILVIDFRLIAAGAPVNTPRTYPAATGNALVTPGLIAVQS